MRVYICDALGVFETVQFSKGNLVNENELLNVVMVFKKKFSEAMQYFKIIEEKTKTKTKTLGTTQFVFN